MQGTRQLVGTIGPALAGFAVALIGVGAAFVIDAVSFAIAALALWYVRSERSAGGPGETAAASAPRPASETNLAAEPSIEGTVRPSVLVSLLEGARAVLGDPTMRAIVIVSTAANLAFTGPTTVGLPWLVLIGFHGDALALGLTFATLGARPIAAWPVRCRGHGASGGWCSRS